MKIIRECGFPRTHIFPYKKRIVYSVLIGKYESENFMEYFMELTCNIFEALQNGVIKDLQN